MLKIISTSDGSDTLYVPDLDEHYHSVNGAIQESMHVYINAGFRSLSAEKADIFELGFGTGLNALLTLRECSLLKKRVSYTSVELYPLGNSLINKLNYTDLTDPELKDVFRKMHSAGWDEEIQINNYFCLHKIKSDIRNLRTNKKFDLIYFDAFGPDKQPDLWQADIFGIIASLAREGCIFVTYSAKGQLKRELRSIGFEVEHLPGPPGKRQITRAVCKRS